MIAVVILSAWAVLLFTCFAILVTVLTMSWMGMEVPAIIADHSKVSLGFLFGSLLGMVKDLLAQKSAAHQQSSKGDASS